MKFCYKYNKLWVSEPLHPKIACKNVCLSSQSTEVSELAVDAVKVSSEAGERSVFSEYLIISQRCSYISINCLFALTSGKKDKRRNKLTEKKDSHHKSQCSESSPKPGPPPKDDPPHKKSETPPPAQGEDKQKQPQPSPAVSPKDLLLSSASDDPKQSQTPLSSAFRKERKQQPSFSPTSLHAAPSSPLAQSQQSLQHQSQMPAKKEGLAKSQPTEPKKKSQQQSQSSSAADTGKEMKIFTVANLTQRVSIRALGGSPSS